MYNVLRARGHDVRLFAQSSNPNGIEVSEATNIEGFLRDRKDILFYHYSMGWDFGLQLLRKVKCLKVLKYHNITPPEFFRGISREYEDTCSRGRQQIKDIAAADCDLYLADSEYNLWELLLEGIDKAKGKVLPPFHHIDKWNSLPPDLEVLNAYKSDQTKVLMVGRVAPNKGHAMLIQSFQVYKRHYDSQAILFIVGKEPEYLETYSQSLRKTVERLGLEDSVIFTGGVSDAQLKSYYLLANVFMITSQHEGFCVPLVEAMAMKIPIVACASSAIPGTIGKAGIVWRERNPFLLAESINFLANDETIGANLGLAGWRRYEQLFSNAKVEAQLLNALEPLI
jgi:glycosyltransferase involved in cell wall biosynthesis